MRPDEISDLLGTDPESVIVAREQALEHLADELGLDDASGLDDMRARLAELPPESWTGSRAPLPQVEAIMEEPVPAARPMRAEHAPQEPKRKSRLPLLLALLAVAAVVLVVILASSGDDTSTVSQAPPSAPAPAKPARAAKAAPGKPSRSAPKPSPAPASAKLPLTVIGGGASGTASLLDGGRRLHVAVSGLPAGAYQVWLYNSIIDARSLGAAKGPTLALDLALPSNATHYKYIDISREPADGNPNHSGLSVLRVPLAKLAR
jgi:hypothetical protein